VVADGGFVSNVLLCATDLSASFFFIGYKIWLEMVVNNFFDTVLADEFYCGGVLMVVDVVSCRYCS
jgi:hypothetical protein